MNSFTDIYNKVVLPKYNKVSSGAFLYGYAVVALLLPNIALCYTECLAPWACGANVLLPLALYMWFFSLTRCPGKMIWWAFLFVFFRCLPTGIALSLRDGSDSGRYVSESCNYQSWRGEGTAW